MVLAMFAMVLLTLVVGGASFSARSKAVKSKQLSLNSFVLMDAPKLPENVIKTTRNLNNQFEVPVLFYAACVTYIAVGVESTLGLVLAWAFVLGRVAHAYIHITYNDLTHRMMAFLFSLVAVLLLWLNLVVAVYF